MKKKKLMRILSIAILIIAIPTMLMLAIILNRIFLFNELESAGVAICLIALTILDIVFLVENFDEF